MKKLLCIAFAFTALIANAQVSRDSMIVLKYDTTVVDVGIDTTHTNHQWEVEDLRDMSKGCTVIHDATGCKESWLHNGMICSVCLRNIEIQETRTIGFRGKGKYQVLKEKLKTENDKKDKDKGKGDNGGGKGNGNGNAPNASQLKDTSGTPSFQTTKQAVKTKVKN